MFKKFTAIFTLYTACAIMLTFAVLPHHHHQQYICFNTIHCQAGDHHHSHDDSPYNSSESCVKQLFQTQISRGQTLDHSCGDSHCHHFIVPLFLAADILQLLSQEISRESLPDNFYREKLHAVFYTNNRAGRAPPIWS